MVFLKRFVLPYISGILEQLSTDGYSKIICSNNQLVLLDGNNGETLNLKQGWSEYKKSQVTSDSADGESATINMLCDKCNELAQELELLKLVSNQRHSQYAKELVRVEKEIKEKADCKLADESVEDMRKINKVLIAHIENLEEKLEQKTEEYELLSKLFASQACCLQHNDSLELLRKQTSSWRSKKLAQRRMSTNTDKIQTKDEGANTGCSQKSKKIGTGSQVTRPPVVQKATSYAAAPSHDAPSAQAEKKQTTTSDRSLPASLTNDQQSFLKLLQKVLNSEQTNESKPVAENTESSDSLGEAMRRLFEIYSTPSLASTTTSRHSVKSDASILEAIRALFATESSTHDLIKKNSYPPTPSNSADNLVRDRLSKDVKHSTSMRKVLEKLLNVGEEQTAPKPTSESKSSLWSLGEAMIKAFQEDLSSTDIQTRKDLNTSNESLSQAMHWLFDTLSQQSLPKQSNSDISQDTALDSSSSSLGSILLWGLAEPTPEDYKNIDVKAVNQAKQGKRKTLSQTPSISSVDCECHSGLDGRKEMKNPSFSSVSRMSSPDRDVDIAFPPLNKNLFSNKAVSGQHSSQAQTTTPFTFKTSTDMDSLVSDTTKSTANKTSLEENIKQATKKLSRPSRSSRKRTSYKCSHCGVVIQSRSVGQTEYRMNRHIRLHHRNQEDPWYM
ncbi:serine-rich adhesin for platelets-like [Watersipora subatra]|uniref:serine-rich adhesin for platelets-like n=1 Tax=Watersipora subatra TaxID=2589382 RepID=UPI00355B5778